DFAASVRALVNHFAVALGIDLDLEVDADVDVDVDVEPDEELQGDAEVELLSDGFEAQRAVVLDEETDSDFTPVDDEQEPSEGGEDDLPP
ncbi:UNVERIFIED_CONTAM: hypothetical protein NY100_23415, partial [Prevotella sp. 15_C9]